VGANAGERIRFGDFEFDPQATRLFRDGRRAAIQPQPLRVLALLLERPGEIISREELRERIWGSSAFVEFDLGLNYCIRQIRVALRDDAAKPAYIETLPRQGYRFIGAVSAKGRPPSPARAELPLRPPKSCPSIAVLPFTNLSPKDEQQYFGDGLAEEIITALAKLPELLVAGRTSSFFFRDKDADLNDIARHLNVEYILEGSIRREGNRTRVTAQLIKAADGFHVWSERYDRRITDIFAIQDEITGAITEALRLKLSLTPSRPRRRVPNLRAYEAFLEGRHHLLVDSRPESLERGKALLERAVKLDPTLALAYSVLGVYYTRQAGAGAIPAREALALARKAEQAALRLDESLPEAHGMMAACAGMDYNWSEAERHWRLALEREPLPPDVLFWYGNHYLLPIGRASDAVEVETKVLEADTMNLLYRRLYAMALQHAGSWAEAEEELRQILEVDENSPTLSMLGLICARTGRFEEALAMTERAYALLPRSNPLAGQLAALLSRGCDENRASALIDHLRSGEAPGASVGLAVFHAMRGEFDQSALWTERAIEERFPLLIANVGPLIRTAPQWPALAKRMHLPR